MNWPSVLRGLAASPHDRADRFRPARVPGFRYADEAFEDRFELPEGSVRMCLHVVSGHPVKYGVAVVS